MTLHSSGFTSSVLVLALLACAGPSQAPDAPNAARDSAGVEIVENSTPLWTESTRWQVEGSPSLQIGEGVDGSAELQFANIAGVHRLPGGGIGVLDSWAPAVSFFDSTGVFLGRVGREGTGPGEFPPRSWLSSFVCGGDTLYVVVQQRISAFTPPNKHVRTFSLDRPARIRACTIDRFVAEQRHASWRNATGLFTDSLLLTSHDRKGLLRSVLDTLPAQETNWERGPEGFGYSRHLFGRVLSVTGQGTTLATGFGDVFQIELRDTTGAVSRMARVTGLDRSVGTADIERFRAFVFNPWRGNQAERAHLEARLESARGRPLPAFGELRLDRADNIWARQFDHLDAVAFYDYSGFARGHARATLNEPRRWVVLRGDGRYLGEITTPPRFIVHEIGENWILGVWRDDFDIQFVRQYRLLKPRP